MKNLRINFAPSNFLLDSEGKIIAKDLDPHLLADFLQKNLKVPATSLHVTKKD